MSFKEIAFFTIAFFCFNISKAQNASFTVKGYVYDESGKALEDVSVIVEGMNIVTETKENGFFEINLLKTKRNKVHFSKVSFEPFFRYFHSDAQNISEKIILKKDSKHIDLEEVSIATNTPITTLRQSAYNVVVIDAKPYYNTTLDLAHVVDRVSGVKVRETGGVGSSMAISLNGFTGRHVKVFMDGVPMEGMGSAFQLNNIPVNIAERIEVYKGVVPIEFGTDAIGGVINIVTKKGQRTHIDASYSYGSFNTHKSNIDFGMTSKKGFTFNVNAFQNYSDNSYKVWMDEILNLNTLVYEQNPQWVKRFHDRYHNETLVANMGFVNKKWTDKFLIGVTLGQEQADIQNAFLMKIVYGMRQKKGSTVMPNLTYMKRNIFVNGLNLTINSNYSINSNKNFDTASRRYNWLGEWVTRSTMGEAGSTLAEFKNENFSNTANLTYHLSRQHSFAVNDVYNDFKRKSEDPAALIADESEMAQYMQRKNKKNVFGFSYKYDYNKKWNTSIFAKNYRISVAGPVNVATIVNTYDWEYQSTINSVWGYGIATTYFLNDGLQLKGSYEKAARLPTDGELFGDQVLLTENSGLRPERSHNVNLGLTFNKSIAKNHSIYADLGFIYRSVYDYIRQVVDERYGTQGSVNHGKVRNVGFNTEIKYFYKDMFTVGGTLTYQNLRNRERTVSAISNVSTAIYNDRLPNVPYFFGNTDITGFFKNILREGSTLSLTYSTNYIHSFFLQWPSQGASNSKYVVPGQFSHDILASYALFKGKYNIGLEARNITNQKLYDNFSLQKPGRNFAVKLRYNFVK